MTAPLRPAPPQSEFAYEAEIDIASRQSLGASALGERFIVPIVGGRFDVPDSVLWLPRLLG